MAECERKNKWWRGCKFEARYSRPAFPNLMSWMNGNSIVLREDIAAIEAQRPIIYEGDVCVRCGKFVPKSGQAREE